MTSLRSQRSQSSLVSQYYFTCSDFSNNDWTYRTDIPSAMHTDWPGWNNTTWCIFFKYRHFSYAIRYPYIAIEPPMPTSGWIEGIVHQLVNTVLNAFFVICQLSHITRDSRRNPLNHLLGTHMWIQLDLLPIWHPESNLIRSDNPFAGVTKIDNVLTRGQIIR